MKDNVKDGAVRGLCACPKDRDFESAAVWPIILALLRLGSKDRPERDLQAVKICYLSGKVDALEDMLYGRQREAKHETD